jgi:hypothetical protein
LLALAMTTTALVAVPSAASAALTALTALAERVDEWASGTMHPGESKDFVMDVASPAAAYQASLVPFGASTTTACRFELTHTWYAQRTGGAREFHIRITNVGSIPCATQVKVGSVEPFRTWSTGALDPGASRNWTWNNANPINSVYLVGLSPNGATPSTRCEFEVKRLRYVQYPGGERRLGISVRNRGAIACSADVQLARTASLPFPREPFPMEAGETVGFSLNFGSGLVDPTRPIAAGWSPREAITGHPCVIDELRRLFEQSALGDGDGPTSADVMLKNPGTAPCSVVMLFAQL